MKNQVKFNIRKTSFLNVELMKQKPKLILGKNRKSNINALWFFSQLTDAIINLGYLEQRDFDYNFLITFQDNSTFETYHGGDYYSLINFKFPEMDEFNIRHLSANYDNVYMDVYDRFEDEEDEMSFKRIEIENIKSIEFLAAH